MHYVRHPKDNVDYETSSDDNGNSGDENDEYLSDVVDESSRSTTHSHWSKRQSIMPVEKESQALELNPWSIPRQISGRRAGRLAHEVANETLKGNGTDLSNFFFHPRDFLRALTVLMYENPRLPLWNPLMPPLRTIIACTVDY